MPVGTFGESGVAGHLLAGRYRMIEPLGRGGMGAVWRATDDLLHREVAVKEILIPRQLPPREIESLRRRSLREARIAARLNHPALITVHDVVIENGQPSIVMEFVPSRSLWDVLEERGRMPPERAAQVALAVLSGLRVAHNAGILHRDVKPSNILLGFDGRVVLTDFGLARFATDAAAPLTMPGQVVGTPGYIAPEFASGERAVGPAADLWSLGATLYTVVEGEAPYRAESFLGWLGGVVAKDPPPPRYAGPLAPVIAGLMVRDPAARLTVDGASRMLTAILERQTERQTERQATERPAADRPTAEWQRPAPARPPRAHTAAPGPAQGRYLGEDRPTDEMLAADGRLAGARIAAARQARLPASLPPPPWWRQSRNLLALTAAAVLIVVGVVVGLLLSAATHASSGGTPTPSLTQQTTTTHHHRRP